MSEVSCGIFPTSLCWAFWRWRWFCLQTISTSCLTSLGGPVHLLHIFQPSHAYAYSSSNLSDYLLPSFRTLSNLLRSVKQQELLRDKIVSNLEFQRQDLSLVLQVISGQCWCWDADWKSIFHMCPWLLLPSRVLMSQVKCLFLFWRGN